MHSRRLVILAAAVAFLAGLLWANAVPAQTDAPPPVTEAQPSPPAAQSPDLPPAARTTAPDLLPPLPPVLELGLTQEIALTNNPTLQAAEARVRQADARVKQAVSAYFPQLSASFSATRTSLAENVVKAGREAAFSAPFAPLQSQLQSVLQGQAALPDAATIAQQVFQAGIGGVIARGAVPDTVDNYAAGAAASWLIFDGFGRWFTRATARYGMKQTEEAFRENQRLILSAVTNAFYNVQLQRENIGIAQADQSFNERLLTEAQARRRVGTGSLSDQLNFEIRVRTAQASLLQAQNAYAVGLIGLATLMGLPDAGFPAGTEVAPLTAETTDELQDPPGLEDLLAYSIEHRPDLNAGRFGVKAAHANVGVNRARFFPTAVAIASKDAQRSNNAKFEEDDFAGTIGVTVSYDIFTGFRRKAQVAEARAAEVEAQRMLQDAQINASSEVRQALQSLLTSRDQLVLQRLNMENVQRNRDLVEREYEVGQASLVRVNEAQRDLTQAQVQLAAARVSLRQAWFALKTATGESLLPYTEE